VTAPTPTPSFDPTACDPGRPGRASPTSPQANPDTNRPTSSPTNSTTNPTTRQTSCAKASSARRKPTNSSDLRQRALVRSAPARTKGLPPSLLARLRLNFFRGFDPRNESRFGPVELPKSWRALEPVCLLADACAGSVAQTTGAFVQRGKQTCRRQWRRGRVPSSLGSIASHCLVAASSLAIPTGFARSRSSQKRRHAMLPNLICGFATFGGQRKWRSRRPRTCDGLYYLTFWLDATSLSFVPSLSFMRRI
jgi:hypothetical protein